MITREEKRLEKRRRERNVETSSKLRKQCLKGHRHFSFCFSKFDSKEQKSRYRTRRERERERKPK